MTMGLVFADLRNTLGIELLDALSEAIEDAGYALLISTARGEHKLSVTAVLPVNSAPLLMLTVLNSHPTLGRTSVKVGGGVFVIGVLAVGVRGNNAMKPGTSE